MRVRTLIGLGLWAATSTCMRSSADPRAPEVASSSSSALCATCESNHCPHDSTQQPACSDFASAADRASCQAVLDCIRATNCIASSNVACFCGSDLDIATCKRGPSPHGDCVKQIRAAFPLKSSSADIVNAMGDVSIPGGAALNLGQCDHDYCGEPDLGGHNECVPFHD